jgi:hypothetical protein
MPWVEFEPTIPASERANKVHALDRSATVTSLLNFKKCKLLHVKDVKNQNGVFLKKKR